MLRSPSAWASPRPAASPRGSGWDARRLRATPLAGGLRRSIRPPRWAGPGSERAAARCERPGSGRSGLRMTRCRASSRPGWPADSRWSWRRASRRARRSLELLLGPAHADPEDEPSATELVHHRGGARRLQRMAIGHDDDRRAELDLLRDAGQPAQHGERLVEGCGIPPGHVRRDGDVVGSHQKVIAEPFDDLDPARERARLGAGTEVDEIDSDLHAMACASPGTTVSPGSRRMASGATLILEERLPPPRMT